MPQQRKKPANVVRQIDRLEDIPNVGPAVAADLRLLGITTPGDLPGRDPYAMYDDLCRITGHRHDPCVPPIVLQLSITAMNWRGQLRSLEQPQAVEDHEQRRSHICGNCGPKRGKTKESQSHEY
jgi:hypothetical protein